LPTWEIRVVLILEILGIGGAHRQPGWVVACGEIGEAASQEARTKGADGGAVGAYK
jgi:hypothetical protein